MGVTENTYPASRLELRKEQVWNGRGHTQFWKRLPGDSDEGTF